jgi:hypothetical protein
MPRPDELAPLIARLSDPGPGPHADNFVSNEDSYPRVAPLLRAKAPPGTVYLGVGPDQNFTLIAHARPSRAFILDYRRRNLRLHLLHHAIFVLADDRASYLRLLTARDPVEAPADALAAAFERATFSRDLLATVQSRVEAVLRPLGIHAEDEWGDLRTIHARVAGPGLDARFLALPMYPTLGRMIRTTGSDGQAAHFLATEELYRAVRDLQRAQCVVPLVGDLAGDGCLPRLASWLQERGEKVGVVYSSDVEFFLLRDGRLDVYARNLDRLPRHPDALLVRSTSQRIDHPSRCPGDTGTTIAVGLDDFLQEVRDGQVMSPDDLFRQPGG